MGTEFISIHEIKDDLPDSFNNEMKKLEQNIRNEEIPSWILIPKRKAGEHASGAAWMGAIWGMVSSGEDTMTARVAWDTKDRARQKSTTGDVPSEIQDVIVDGMDEIDGDIEMCALKLKYDLDTRDLEEIDIGYKVKYIEDTD